MNNPDKEINILKQQSEETQLQRMQDPCNIFLWMHKNDLQERVQ